VTYVELNSPDLERSTAFFEAVFGWEFQPFASPEYLVAPGRRRRRHRPAGVAGRSAARRSRHPGASLEAVTADVVVHGGAVVVPPFSVPGVGRGCYVTDPAGLLIGLHEYDAQA
jgi:predicted enzyme related to lactoylglutathione lyase